MAMMDILSKFKCSGKAVDLGTWYVYLPVQHQVYTYICT